MRFSSIIVLLDRSFMDSSSMREFQPGVQGIENVLNKAKACLKSYTEHIAAAEHEDEETSIADDSDTSGEELEPRLRFYIKLLMQLVPAMDKTFVQASRNSQKTSGSKPTISKFEQNPTIYSIWRPWKTLNNVMIDLQHRRFGSWRVGRR